MNRETKRLMQRQGQMEADGSPATRQAAAAQTQRRPPRRRASIAQFAREVRDEIRKVGWPSRTELVNYTAVVLVTLVIMVSLIFLLNLGFGKAVLYLFQK